MLIRKSLRRNSALQTTLYLAVATLLGGLAVWSAASLGERNARAQLALHANETLELQSDTIVGQLEKYRLIPGLMARRADIDALFLAADPDQADAVARRLVFDMTALSGAVDAALFLPSGRLIANATGYLQSTMITQNSLLVSALQGSLGRASISGENGRRSYAFSSPVRHKGEIAAILVVAAPLESIEQTWALSVNPIFALNRSGQLVAGNLIARMREPELRLALLKGADSDAFLASSTTSGAYMAYSRSIPAMDWQLFVLEPTDLISASARDNTLIALLSSLLAGLAGFVLLVRRQEADRQRRAERLAAIRLERQVRDRTRELRLANARLEIEVDERRTAENALLKAQGELVQSAKLAAIGQMSAALAHEYNQPLAAIRSYAENAVQFLARGSKEPVRDNLQRIGGLVERMATLSTTLKSFARRPRSGSSDVLLETVMRDSLMLAGHKAKEAGIVIKTEPVPDALMVRGGQVRLSQVFVNLISNAVDANIQAGGKNVFVEVAADDDTVRIDVLDEGTGIDQEINSSIFDPFFTTKDVGEGLGLGLSIAYNIIHDFGGTLTARNRNGGGAVFSVTLPRALPMASKSRAAE